jgi:serine/threonine-protein kinase
MVIQFKTELSDRYHVVRSLGEGGMGETFLAEDTQMPSGRLCVVKRLKAQTDQPAAQKMIEDRFQREAAILEDLSRGCQQIPDLYAYFIQDESFYLVQEWVDGQTLLEKVQHHGVLSEAATKTILGSLLHVLDFVHSKGIVHRDVKPENIILRQADELPFLIDFGAVRETMGTVLNSQGNPSKSIVIGTPGFMPSEQAVGRPVYGSDLYSLGLTGIYLLTGHLPQELDTDPQSGALVWRQYAPQVSPSLANWLDRAIQAHPRDRFASARDMLAALQAPDGQTATLASLPASSPTVLSNLPPQTPAHAATGSATVLSATHPGQPTMLSAPPTYPPAGTMQPSPNPYASPPTQPPKQGMDDWLKAIIVGVVVGGSILGGMLLTRSQLSPQTTASPETKTDATATDTTATDATATGTGTTNSATTTTPTQTPSITVAPAVSPRTNVAPAPSAAVAPTPATPTSAITKNMARELVNNWQVSKRDIFAPPFSFALLTQFNTDDLYRRNSGSVEWLRDNGAHYEYASQSVDSVESFSANGDQATIDVVLTESRKLYKNGRLVQDENTAYDTRLVRYEMRVDGGQLKLTDYNTLRVIRSSN